MRHKKAASNRTLAALVVIVIIISLAGNFIINSAIPESVPVGEAKVSVNVVQSPSRSTGQVTLFVLAPLG